MLDGELESTRAESRAQSRRRARGDVTIIGCHGPLVPHGLLVKAGGGLIQVFRANPSRVGARLVSRMFAPRRLAEIETCPPPMSYAGGVGR